MSVLSREFSRDDGGPAAKVLKGAGCRRLLHKHHSIIYINGVIKGCIHGSYDGEAMPDSFTSKVK